MTNLQQNSASTKLVEECPTWQQRRLKWSLAKFWGNLVRVRELQLTQKTFADTPEICRTVRKLYGYKMHLDLSRGLAQQQLYLQGKRFITERRLFEEYVKPGMSVVDVGANIGYHTLAFAHLVGSSGKVISIEPSPENLIELRANIVNNNLTNVRLEEIAIGARTTTARIRGGINSGVLLSGGAPGIGEVTLKPLGDVLPEKVDFVKIDVDGYEGEVIQGAAEVLYRDRPTLLLEMHPHMLPRFNSSVQSILDILRDIYPRIEAFDQFRADSESPLTRIMRRYWNSDRLNQISNLDHVAKLGDDGQHNWTFWIVAHAH